VAAVEALTARIAQLEAKAFGPKTVWRQEIASVPTHPSGLSEFHHASSGRFVHG